MSNSRHSEDKEEVCNKCGQIRETLLLRTSKDAEGQEVLVCKDHRSCGKALRTVIRALVRRTVRDTNGNLLSNRRLQWVFQEIGNEQIKMTGPLLPAICPSLREIKNLIDGRHKIQYNEEGNQIVVVCLDYSKYTTTEQVKSEAAAAEEDEEDVVSIALP